MLGRAVKSLPSSFMGCFCVAVVVRARVFSPLSLSGKCNIVSAQGYRAPNVVTIVFSPTSTHISVSLHLILSRFILVSQGFFLLFTRLKEKQCSLYFTFPPASTLHLLSHSVFVLALPLPSQPSLPHHSSCLCGVKLVVCRSTAANDFKVVES